MRLIKSGKITSVKEKALRSPYLIPEAQLQHLYDIATTEISADNQKEVTSSEKTESKPHQPQPHLPCAEKCDHCFQIQKNITETMLRLASTQEQIALTLAQLLKKV